MKRVNEAFFAVNEAEKGAFSSLVLPLLSCSTTAKKHTFPPAEV
jgi:hypothetical protein